MIFRELACTLISFNTQDYKPDYQNTFNGTLAVKMLTISQEAEAVLSQIQGYPRLHNEIIVSKK
jgi:hypothetical protein